MNRGYAFGFLLILLVVVLGLYVAFTGFMSSREATRAQAPEETAGPVAQASDTAAASAASATATIFLLPTPVPGITATLTAVALPAATEPVPPPESTEPPPPPPTELPTAELPTDTPAPVQPPTPVPVPAYQFRLAGPASPDPNFPNCCYILGTVKDAAGNGLEGVRVQASNEWNSLPPAVTKAGGEAGEYDIVIGNEVITWYIMVIDANGNQISTQVQVQFDPAVANGYRVNWQRTY
jgi:hypothetical protein